MPLNFFRPFAKDFGAHFLAFDCAPVATASATVNFGVGAISDKDDTNAFHAGFVDEVFISATTVAAGGGAITGKLVKYDAAAGAAVDLTAAFDLTSGGITANKADRIAITGTEAQRRLNPGDFLYFAVTAASTVTTNLAGAKVTVLVKLLK